MKQQALAYTFLIMFALSIIFTGVIIYKGWHVFQAWSRIAITIIIVSLCVAVPLGILLAFGFGFARLYRHLLHTHIFQQEHAAFFNPFTKSFVQPDRYKKPAAQITSTKVEEVDTPSLPGASSFRD